jgi:serine protease Do
MKFDMKKPDLTVFKDKSKQAGVLSAVLMILIGGSAGFVGGWVGSEASRENALNESSSQQIISNESDLISKIAKEVGPSVVSVNVTNTVSRQSFFGIEPIEQQSAGTGFIVSEDGVIVTNRHVVPAGTDEVSVTLSDGTELTDVEVVGRTNENDSLDLAFLKIKDAKGKDLRPVKLGDSSKMEVGDKAIAIGNALGQFQNTVTTGIISGYGRDVVASDEQGQSTETLQNLFQTDAAINQGNSGGPLVNLSGEVIGVNTAIAGDGAENIGFAIPINDAQGLISSVLQSGKLERPYLGVRYVSLTDDYAYEFNLDIKRGAYIVPSSRGQQSILKDSPAEKAGLKEKDIITKISGEEINEKNSLTSLIGRHKVGEEVTLTIVRDGNEQEVKVTLEASPEN